MGMFLVSQKVIAELQVFPGRVNTLLVLPNNTHPKGGEVSPKWQDLIDRAIMENIPLGVIAKTYPSHIKGVDAIPVNPTMIQKIH